MPLTAEAGYVGTMVLDDAGNKFMVRVTSSDVKVTQDVSTPEVIDGRVDHTLIQIGPKIVGGTVSFPLVHEGSALGTFTDTCTSTNDTLTSTLWRLATGRDQIGRKMYPLDIYMRYSDATKALYPACYINSMTWTITHEAPVAVSFEVFGTANDPREVRDTGYPEFTLPGMLSPARVVQWNDAEVKIWTGDENSLVTSDELREFTATLNNGLERVFTLNGQLKSQDIVAKKREINGSLRILGRNVALANLAWINENMATSQNVIAMGYSLGNNGGLGGQKYWATAFHSVVFNIEEMAMTTGVFETTVNWRAMGDCQREFQGTQIGKANVTLDYPGTGMDSTDGTYGGRTAGSDALPFPTFS